MKSSENERVGFMAEGHQRGADAIRAEVEAEFAEKLAVVTPLEQEMICKDMERVIQERINTEAPPDALY